NSARKASEKRGPTACRAHGGGLGESTMAFILTTSEYILNIAKRRYEVLAHPPVDLTMCVINLSDYTRPIRAKILYNHIYFSDCLTNTNWRCWRIVATYSRAPQLQSKGHRIHDAITLRMRCGTDPLSPLVLGSRRQPLQHLVPRVPAWNLALSLALAL